MGSGKLQQSQELGLEWGETSADLECLTCINLINANGALETPGLSQ